MAVYCGSTKWSAVTIWSASTAYVIGDIRRQTAALGTLTAGNERVFRCTTAGTSGGSEPTWTLTKGSTTADNTAVWTEITGSSTYNSPNNFAAPHARLRKAFDWSAAGDTIYVSNHHAAAEAATVTYTFPGTAASPTVVLCIDDTQATATLATGATETTTAGGGMAPSGAVLYVNGVTFTPSAYFDSRSATKFTLENGTITCGTSGSFLIFGGETTFLNVVLNFTSTSQLLYSQDATVWIGGSLTGTIPTTLFNGFAAGGITVIGVDLSAAGSGKTLIYAATATYHRTRLIDCKLGASVAISGGTPTNSSDVAAINCDSSDPTTAGYRYSRTTYQGTVSNETTIVRTGGGNDNNTGGFSRKFVSSANSKFQSPLIGPWFYFWNETLSSITAAIEVVTDNVTLTDAEAWVEVEALTNSGFPYGSLANDRAADILTTPANQTTSSETWTTTGLTTPVKQTLSKAVTPAEKGWVRARACLAKASTTMYACPKIKSDSAYQWMDGEGNVLNAPAAGAATGGFVIGC